MCLLIGLHITWWSRFTLFVVNTPLQTVISVMYRKSPFIQNSFYLSPALLYILGPKKFHASWIFYCYRTFYQSLLCYRTDWLKRPDSVTVIFSFQFCMNSVKWQTRVWDFYCSAVIRTFESIFNVDFLEELSDFRTWFVIELAAPFFMFELKKVHQFLVWIIATPLGKWLCKNRSSLEEYPVR